MKCIFEKSAQNNGKLGRNSIHHSIRLWKTDERDYSRFAGFAFAVFFPCYWFHWNSMNFSPKEKFVRRKSSRKQQPKKHSLLFPTAQRNGRSLFFAPMRQKAMVEFVLFLVIIIFSLSHTRSLYLPPYLCVCVHEMCVYMRAHIVCVCVASWLVWKANRWIYNCVSSVLYSELKRELAEQESFTIP